jgi:hypothetical protein
LGLNQTATKEHRRKTDAWYYKEPSHKRRSVFFVHYTIPALRESD